VTHNRRASKSGKTNSKALLFFGNFFQIFKESVIKYSFEIFIFRILAKFDPQKKNAGANIIK